MCDVTKTLLCGNVAGRVLRSLPHSRVFVTSHDYVICGRPLIVQKPNECILFQCVAVYGDHKRAVSSAASHTVVTPSENDNSFAAGQRDLPVAHVTVWSVCYVVGRKSGPGPTCDGWVCAKSIRHRTLQESSLRNRKSRATWWWWSLR